MTQPLEETGPGMGHDETSNPSQNDEMSSCVKLCQVVSSWQFLHAAVSPEKMEDLQHDLSGVRLQLETVPW